MKKLLLAMSLLLSSSAMADKTNYGKIRQINYNGDADYAFFVTSGTWEVTDGTGQVTCNPVYVQIPSNVGGRDKLLSVALSAYHAKQRVQFHGTCSSHEAYFNASYIIIRED